MVIETKWSFTSKLWYLPIKKEHGLLTLTCSTLFKISAKLYTQIPRSITSQWIGPHRPVAKVDSSDFDGLTSIDNWYDYLDRPTNPAIIRVNNKWVVRLAFAAIPFPDREKLIIGSQEICWPAQNVLLRIQAYQMTDGFF